MIVHQIFAQIDNKQVKNIMVCENYEIANYITRSAYGKQAFAVDCLQYPCKIGDKYYDGMFFEVLADGTEKIIDPLPTQEQQVLILENELNNQIEYNLDMDYRTSKLELEL